MISNLGPGLRDTVQFSKATIEGILVNHFESISWWSWLRGMSVSIPDPIRASGLNNGAQRYAVTDLTRTDPAPRPTIHSISWTGSLGDLLAICGPTAEPVQAFYL